MLRRPPFRFVAATTLTFMVAVVLALLVGPLLLGATFGRMAARDLAVARGGNSGKAAAAIAGYSQALRWWPGDTRLLQGLAAARAASGDLQGAAEALEQARAQQPESILLQLELAEAYERLALAGVSSVDIADDSSTPRTDALIADGRAIAVWRDAGVIPEQFVARGLAVQRTGDHAEARAWWQRALALAPGFGDPPYYLGMSLIREGHWAPARQLLGMAASATWLTIPSSDVLVRLGSTYHQGPVEDRDLNLAAQFYGEAIHRDAFSSDALRSDAWYLRGHAYELLGRLVDALAQYERAVELNPESRWAQLRLGSARFRVGGDRDSALAAIERALALWPADVSLAIPYLYRADIYRDAGQPEQAAADYREALRIDPSNQHAAAQLAALEE